MASLTKSRQEPIGLETRAPQTGVKFKDILVLKQLQDFGADLTVPRHVLYYLSSNDRAAAESAARTATEAGFDTTVGEPDSENPDDWGVLCERESYVLSMDIVRDNTDYFEELAARLGGEYDGWEASAD